MVAETSHVESSPLFNWLGPVVAGISPCISVEDHGRICRTYGVETLPFTFAQSSFGALRASGALFSVLVDLDGPTADLVASESPYHCLAVLAGAKIDETVGWITASERVDRHVEIRAVECEYSILVGVAVVHST